MYVIIDYVQKSILNNNRYFRKCPLVKQVYTVNDEGWEKSKNVSLPSLNESAIVTVRNKYASTSDL